MHRTTCGGINCANNAGEGVCHKHYARRTNCHKVRGIEIGIRTEAVGWAIRKGESFQGFHN